MKKLATILIPAVAVGIFLWAFGALTGGADEEKEVKISAADLPDAVRATLEKEAPGAKIEEIEKEEEDGKVVYEIEVVIDGKEVELEIAEDGTLLEKEADKEDEEKDGDDEEDEDDDEEDDED